MKQRRPAGLDYHADVHKRCRGPLMVNLAALGANPAQERKPYQVVDRIALVEITGLLTNDPYWSDETGYQEIRVEVGLAAADPDADGILLVVNSPGGYTDHCFETAAAIAEAGKQKPVWAVAANMAYSAAYALTSQASRIYAAPFTGGVGSIGVYAAHWEYSRMLDKAGIQVTTIAAGEGKTDGNPYEPLSERARKDMEAEIGRLYGVFTATVARGRGMPESQVRKLGAYLYEGAPAAIAAGLADAPGTVERALAELAAHIVGKKNKFPVSGAAAAASAQTTKEVSTMVETNQPAAGIPAPPDSLAQGRQEGRDQALADVQEIAVLCQIAGAEDQLPGFLAAGKTPAEVRAALLQRRAAAADMHGVDNKTMPQTSAAQSGSLRERMIHKHKQEAR